MTTLFPNLGFQAANEQRPWNETIVDLASRRPAGTMSADELELHAYVDACLAADRRARVEARLANNPEAGVMVAGYRRLNTDLRRLFDQELPPPAVSLETLSRELQRRLEALSDAETLESGLIATLTRTLGWTWFGQRDA